MSTVFALLFAIVLKSEDFELDCALTFHKLFEPLLTLNLAKSNILIVNCTTTLKHDRMVGC